MIFVAVGTAYSKAGNSLAARICLEVYFNILTTEFGRANSKNAVNIPDLAFDRNPIKVLCLDFTDSAAHKAISNQREPKFPDSILVQPKQINQV